LLGGFRISMYWLWVETPGKIDYLCLFDHNWAKLVDRPGDVILKIALFYGNSEYGVTPKWCFVSLLSVMAALVYLKKRILSRKMRVCEHSPQMIGPEDSQLLPLWGDILSWLCRLTPQ